MHNLLVHVEITVLTAVALGSDAPDYLVALRAVGYLHKYKVTLKVQASNGIAINI